jgi:hypothetical protein
MLNSETSLFFFFLCLVQRFRIFVPGRKMGWYVCVCVVVGGGGEEEG